MRQSEFLIPTLREEPQEAEVESHRWMLRAGMIRKLSAGIYEWLPLGLRVLRNVERIVREEMVKAGAQELLLPAMQPAELWQETGRWGRYGKELIRLRDRHERDFCLGPTHEEVITDLVRREVKSYRQLPINLFQIQTKFRDEIRPRFGVMRGREFIMKDAYSFDRDEEGARLSYRRMYDAYCAIFHRCGLKFKAVEADPGLIGGSSSHEFMVLAGTGEEGIVSCTRCDYAANIERAECPAVGEERSAAPLQALQRAATPGKKSVAEVSAFLNVPDTRLVKTLIVKVNGKAVVCLIRGDHELNEVKLKNLLGAAQAELADPTTVQRVTGGPSGFSGPIGLSGIEIIADNALIDARDLVIGANEKDAHFVGAAVGRDFSVSRFADLRKATDRDPCPRCGGPVEIFRGIEVGHVFMLGTKYSVAMKASFLDADGTEKPFIMGCYGIGVSRVVAAAIEQNHDENGIIWPEGIAPFSVHLLLLQEQSPQARAGAETLYRALTEKGIEVLYDDRAERPGVKFKDADLLGIPVQAIISEKKIVQGEVELKVRRTAERRDVPVERWVGEVRGAPR